MDDIAHWRLASELARRTGDASAFGDYTAILDRADILAEACVAAIDPRPGRPSDRTLNVTVVRLLNLFEQLTGHLAKHSAARHTRYDGEPRSEAGVLVMAFIEQVDPKLPPQSVSTILARYVGGRNRSRAA